MRAPFRAPLAGGHLDFFVVGAHPPGPRMQIMRPTPENHAKAL
jgi:uncharacterized protein YjlB